MEKQVFINKLSVTLPNTAVNNNEMETRLGLIGDKKSRARAVILRSNGIKQRYYAIDPETGKQNYTNAALAAEAVKGLFNDETELAAIDTLVASSSMPDQVMPNHASMVHGELQSPPCEVVSTSGVCLCGVTALKYAYLNVKANESQKSVVVASEVASSIMHARNFDAEHQHKVETLDEHPEMAFEKDFLRWMLSDGAGAALLSDKANNKDISLRIDWIDSFSFANELEACMYAGAEKIDGKLKGWPSYSGEQREQESIMTVKQDVRLLNENIVRITVEETLKRIITKRQLNPADFDYFVPHYSSNYFREKVYQSLVNIDFELPYEKWFTNLPQKGNTGSASIFIMLEELLYSKQLEVGQRILCYIPESGRFSSGFIQLTVV
ncbi:beta-ketoacyl-ACP synthase III [Paraglaciecola aquimarina]|uniref:Beta-ketoacyl-ACP synthase III n=1 Tax=Paraglaciecola aquimarina TaxID=1235557 RepID=A0ABU3SSU0_9ALTE|nr:beta-ketoacyl-ACP synthase III [Paraglaciecola aquimarina]MDU0353043.1 beta-ketoacyl-ACP synthase III [Paraglaciecola aquimarina]